jgi:fibronectin type 3 domain-containing protein
MKRKGVFSALAVMFVTLLMAGCGGGGGSDSPAPPPLPSPPASVSAVPGIGEVTINWTDVTDATSYNVYRSQISPVTKTTGTKTTVADNSVAVSGLDNGIKYYFVVTAVNANGESAESVEVSATPVLPSPPTGVTALPGDATATVQWAAVTGATSYNVYHSETSGVTKTTGTKSTGTANSLVVTGLTNGTPYYFVVTVVVNGLESLESSQVTATPASALPPAPSAPTGVAGAPGAGSATITWPAVAGATSYNIYYSTSSGVTKATGTKVTGAVSGSSIPGLTRGVPYYFRVTAVNAGGESGESNEVTVTPNPPAPVFSQADLAGTWNVRVLRSGSSQGWYLQTITVDNTGSVTVQGSGGPLSPPAVGALSIIAGVVTDGANPTFHGMMSSSKNLIVGTSTYLDTSFALHIFVKRVSGVTYSSGDLANKTFRYHRIYTGSSYFWEKANGSTNASNQITLNTLEDSSGILTLPPVNYTAISVDSTGIVTIGNESLFSGVMSSDKKIIVGTSTDAAGKYSLRIIQMVGQNYTQADLAGETVVHAFGPSPTSGWAYATRSTDASGVVIFSEFFDNAGGTSFPDSFTWNIDPLGNITSSGGTPSSGGGMTFGKDMIVRIGTGSTGSYMEVTVQ